MSLCYELLFRGHNFQKVRHPKTKYQLPSLRCNVWSSLDVFILSRIFPQPQYIARQLYLTSDSYSCPDGRPSPKSPPENIESYSTSYIESVNEINPLQILRALTIYSVPSSSPVPTLQKSPPLDSPTTLKITSFFYNIREKFCAVRILLRLFTSSLTKIIESLK